MCILRSLWLKPDLFSSQARWLAVVLLDGCLEPGGHPDPAGITGSLGPRRDLRLPHRAEVQQHQRRPPEDLQEGETDCYILVALVVRMVAC